MLAIVDTGPLYAAADLDDENHLRCLAVLQRADLDLVVPALVVAEASYLLGTRLGAHAEAIFLRTLESLEVEAPLAEEWSRIADLVERYGGFPLGAADASIIALAQRLGTELIVTLDRRHFRAIPNHDGRPFTLLPD